METSVINTKGVKATSLEETITNADLNWSVESEAVQTPSGVVMPRKKMLYRSDTRLPLGIVGSDYSPSDPKDFLKRQYLTAEKLGGEVTQVGFMPDRARAFAFIKLVKNINIPTRERKKGDPIACYIYNTDGWDGMTPQRSKLYLERLVCTNGMISRGIQASLWVSHTPGGKDRFEARWTTFLDETHKTVAAVRDQFTALAGLGMTQEELNKFLEKLIPGEATMSKNRRAEVGKLFEGGIGNHGNSRWDAFNAVTEYVTHHRNYRTTDVTGEETNRFLGILETDTMSERALALLLN